MKKLLSVLLAAILALTCTLSVSADVIYEPDDNFYTRNSDKCELLERSFIATEEVYSVNEPGSDHVMGKAEKGDKLYISYTYKDSDGIVWGLISFSDVSGWLPMGYLEVIYDDISFAEEFGAEFSSETDGLKLPETEGLVFWEYPGSENYTGMVPWDDGYLDMSFSHSYTDENGIVWGYVGYYYGMDGWLRIDDPNSTETTSLARDNEVLYPNSVLGEDSAVEKGGLSPIWLAVILVGGVSVVTVVLILVLTKKKKA